MNNLLISLAAFIASGLTLFSGFGLGTLLLPVFALFLPVPSAVAATAVVHLLNNLFKLALVGRSADFTVVVRFGVPAILGAWIGSRFVEKVTLRGIQMLVSLLLFAIALGLASGIL